MRVSCNRVRHCPDAVPDKVFWPPGRTARDRSEETSNGDSERHSKGNPGTENRK